LFARLGDEFGVNASNAGTVFRKTLPIISHYIKIDNLAIKKINKTKSVTQ